jgi:hypothetical protein
MGFLAGGSASACATRGPVVVILDFEEIAPSDAGSVDRDAAQYSRRPAERRDIAANIGVVGDLADRQADPAVPLGRKQHDDNPRCGQNRQPDEANPGPPRPAAQPG